LTFRAFYFFEKIIIGQNNKKDARPQIMQINRLRQEHGLGEELMMMY